MRLFHRYETTLQLLSALGAAVVTGWRLHLRGWPWHAWLPAALLVLYSVGVIWILAWFGLRKATYEKIAAQTKAHLAAEGDGWPQFQKETSRIDSETPDKT